MAVASATKVDDEVTTTTRTGGTVSTAPSRACVLGAVAAVHVALALLFARDPRGGLRATLFDDAMVSLTYARNASRGAGAVWNAGQAPVEGYTNPLWTFVMTIIEMVVPPGWAPAATIVISSAALLCAAAVAHSLAGRLAPDDPVAPPVACLGVGLAYPLVFWSLRGMEVGVLTLALLAALLLVDRDDTSLRRLALGGAVAAVSVSIRSDALVPLVAMSFGLVVARGRPALRFAAVVTLAAVAAIFGQTLLRQSWYGEILPNTYYLKLSGVGLWTRVERGVLTLLPFLLVVAAPAAMIALGTGRDRHRYQRYAPTLLPAGALVAYSVYVGGDAWEQFGFANRYLSPALALVIVVAAACVRPAWERSPGPCTIAGLISCAGTELWLNARSPLGVPYADLEGSTPLRVAFAAMGAVLIGEIWHHRRERDATGGAGGLIVVGVVLVLASSLAALAVGLSGGQHVRDDLMARRTGEVIADLTTEDATIAVVWAGNIPYWADRTSVDLLGKADPVIARSPSRTIDTWRPGHDRWDYEHSLGHLEPDLVVQLWAPDADLLALLEGSGYRPVAPRDPDAAAVVEAMPLAWLFARSDSDRIRWGGLQETDWPTLAPDG